MIEGQASGERTPKLRYGTGGGKTKKETTMARPVTLFTGQWADLPFEEVCKKAGGWGYDGPLSVEWEDNAMDRDFGAEEALDFVRVTNFSPSKAAFDKDMKK